MAVIAVTGGKGSPGVTTTWLVMSALWPRLAVAVELDPGGGDVAGLFERPPTPSTSTLAAGLGREGDGGLFSHTQELPGGVRVVLGPTLPSAAASVLAEVGAELPALGTDAGMDILVDLGRLTAGDDGWPACLEVLQVADLVVLVTRPTLVELSHVAGWIPLLQGIPRLDGSATDVGLLLVGPGYGAGEIEENLRVRVLGRLPLDREGAAAALGRGRARADRTPLFRDARPIVEALPARAVTRRVSSVDVDTDAPRAAEVRAW